MWFSRFSLRKNIRLFFFLLLIISISQIFIKLSFTIAEYRIKNIPKKSGPIGADSYYPFDEPLFGDNNPFNMKIPANAIYEQNSKAYMDFFATNQGGEDSFNIGIEKWAYPVYFVDGTEPKYNVKMLNNWGNYSEIKNVPIPDNAAPDPEDDAHMVIIDINARIEYDFWGMKKILGKWMASWGNTISLESDGIYQYGLSARGSGFAASQGLIWPHEIIQGRIEHALFFSIDDKFVKSGGPIRPASESDGTSEEEYALPEGARLQLDPDLDLDSLDLTKTEKIIARALQDYGMILGDNGGGIALSAINPIGQNWSWGDTFPALEEWGAAIIFQGKISIRQFKVLKMGCQIPEATTGLLPGQTLPPYKIYVEGDYVKTECDVGEPIKNNYSAEEDEINGYPTPFIFIISLTFALLSLSPSKRKVENRQFRKE